MPHVRVEPNKNVQSEVQSNIEWDEIENWLEEEEPDLDSDFSMHSDDEIIPAGEGRVDPANVEGWPENLPDIPFGDRPGIIEIPLHRDLPNEPTEEDEKRKVKY